VPLVTSNVICNELMEYRILILLNFPILGVFALAMEYQDLLPIILNPLIAIMGIYITLSFIASPGFVVISSVECKKKHFSKQSSIILAVSLFYMLVALFIVIKLWPELMGV